MAESIYTYYTPGRAATAIYPPVTRQAIHQRIENGTYIVARTQDRQPKLFIPEWSLFPERHSDLDQEQAQAEIEQISASRWTSRQNIQAEPLLVRTSQGTTRLYPASVVAALEEQESQEKHEKTGKRGQWKDPKQELRSVIESINLTATGKEKLAACREHRAGTVSNMIYVNSEIVADGIDLLPEIDPAVFEAWKEGYGKILKGKGDRLRLSLPITTLARMEAWRVAHGIGKNQVIDLAIHLAYLTLDNIVV